jgi:hypothetical protein
MKVPRVKMRRCRRCNPRIMVQYKSLIMMIIRLRLPPKMNDNSSSYQ